MNTKNSLKTETLENYYNQINALIIKSKENVIRNINYEMVLLYFEIGKIINNIIKQYNNEKSQNEIIKKFSQKLTFEFGQGFSIPNLKKMKKFYATYNGGSTLWNQLSWSHNRLIMNIDNSIKRNFYLEETIKSNWSVRQLERQINTFYYERLLSISENNKNAVKKEIDIIEKKEKIKDFIKDPYILEFLDIRNKRFLEKDLESNILEHIQEFLLELGRGFSFTARQKRIDVDGDNFYIDLVFYNYVLKCFVLIDLKLDKLKHQDIGQMNFYTRYYDNEIKTNEDNPTIGIILCSDKKDTIVKYSVLNDNNNLFASKYQFYLPTEKELINEIEKQKQEFEDNKQLDQIDISFNK
ncbi:MAG: PDDEXK nuclease domain-containing protein [Bacilli bacterium]